MKRIVVVVVLLLNATRLCGAAETNLVANGAFEGGQTQAGAPAAWPAAGNPAIRQQLTLDVGREGGDCARLSCTEFNGGEPDFHAMICQVVGGISANLAAGLTRGFVAQGGLRWVDVFDLHMDDPPRPALSYEEPFASLENLMREHGGGKPVWINEWGCYADNDPACVPEAVGDATMNRCRWTSERAATEHIVKFTAVAFAHGVRKIFFHAATCGTINGPDAGGVLFEYGGAPRKMYAGVAALTRLLGVPEESLRPVHEGGLAAYVFRVKHRVVAIAWCGTRPARRLNPASSLRAYDVMGKELRVKGTALDQSPVYLVGDSVQPVAPALGVSLR